jgi:arylsulfatase A-like enzyme
MNVLIFCSDTFRYDHLGFLRRQNVFTPHIDTFAKEAALFSDFRLCSFPTLVNRIEVFTGRYTFPLLDWGPLPFQFPAMAEVFKHHGFTTGLIADNPHLMKEGFGFGRGFDYVRDVPGQIDDHFQPETTPMIELPCPVEKLEPRPRRMERYRRNAYYYQQQGTTTTAVVCQQALDWLKNRNGNFFLWVDCFDPHEPWEAPQQFRNLYPWDPNGDAVFWPRDGKADFYPEADLANMRSLYKAEVSQIDYWFGRVLEQLREQKLLERTAVLFCSDHGYSFGEHGLVGKLFKREMKRSPRIYEELGHIPLLVRHPDGLGAGKTLAGLCQPPDLFATALDLAGIPPVSWTQGHSLLPRLNGEPGKQRFAVSGLHPRKGKINCLTVWSDQWCLVYSPSDGLEGSELYNRASDPSQSENVIALHREVAQEHFNFLRTWLKELNVPRKRLNQLLYAGNFGWLEKLKHRLWLFGNRCSYWTRYRDYARDARCQGSAA